MRHLTALAPAVMLVLLGLYVAPQAAPVHTTYLWHMHQPIYWPDRSTWTPTRYETAYETITLGHSENDVFSIFNKDDRVHDYQDYPKTAVPTRRSPGFRRFSSTTMSKPRTTTAM